MHPVISCSEDEAQRFGRFLSTLLDTIMMWHSDQNVYDVVCENMSKIFSNQLNSVYFFSVLLFTCLVDFIYFFQCWVAQFNPLMAIGSPVTHEN